METFIHDVRFGWRSLRKSPGFTVIAVLALALGIGANTAIFSVVNGVLLKPLPYKEPDRIVELWETNPIRGWTQAHIAPANLFDWQARNQVFEGIAAYRAGTSDLYYATEKEPVRLQGMPVSGNMFDLLGATPLLGRTFTDEETWQPNHQTAILSYDLWQRQFAGDKNIIGKTLLLSGVQRTVVGVMPPDFYFPDREPELWVPIGFNRDEHPQMRRPHMLRAIARIKPGVSLEQAQAEMHRIAAQLEQEHPVINKEMGVGLGLRYEWVVGETRPALLIFLGAVGFVLLIACANVANLLLARSAARGREIAIRTAIGASRARIIRQLLTESMLLAFLAGALGLAIALWGRDILLALSPGDLPRMSEIALDLRVLLFTLGVTFLTATVFGLLPAFAASRTDLTEALKDGVRGTSGSPRRNRARSALVVFEVVLSVVLVSAAGLLMKSFANLKDVQPGMDPENAVSFRLNLPGLQYAEDEQIMVFYNDLQQRLESIPGVLAAGGAARLPLQGHNWTGDFTIEGRADSDYGIDVRNNEVTLGYFKALGIPVVAGREFSSAEMQPRDADTGNLVVMVNEALVRRYLNGEDAVGKRIRDGRPADSNPWMTIIGVVKDQPQYSLAEAAVPQIYWPLSQNTQRGMSVVVRTQSGDPTAIMGAVRAQVRQMDPGLPVFNVAPLTEVLSRSLARDRFNTTLMGVFAGLAMALAFIGLYGVMSYLVAQRTQEIGIRMALGAQRSQVLRMILSQGTLLVAVGVAIGIVSALATSRLLAGLLYGVQPGDPVILLAVSTLLIACALLASWAPARRAASVEPMRALRYE